jgi:hypothetical protein
MGVIKIYHKNAGVGELAGNLRTWYSTETGIEVAASKRITPLM